MSKGVRIFVLLVLSEALKSGAVHAHSTSWAVELQPEYNTAAALLILLTFPLLLLGIILWARLHPLRIKKVLRGEKGWPLDGKEKEALAVMEWPPARFLLRAHSIFLVSIFFALSSIHLSGTSSAGPRIFVPLYVFSLALLLGFWTQRAGVYLFTGARIGTMRRGDGRGEFEWFPADKVRLRVEQGMISRILGRVDLVVESRERSRIAIKNPPGREARGGYELRWTGLTRELADWLRDATPSAATPCSFTPLSSPGHSSRVTISRQGLKKLLRGRHVFSGLRGVVALLFVALVVSGIFGNQDPERNFATVSAWVVWWAGIVIVILFFGSVWCTVCPFESTAIAVKSVARRLGIQGGRRWPPGLRNLSPSIALLVGMTWFDIGFGLTKNPRATALLALTMLILAAASSAVFARRPFCRYVCPIGRISGLYSMFSPVEIRSCNRELCRGCGRRACALGKDGAGGCPTFQRPWKMRLNTYCTMCMRCLASCSRGNIRVRLRPFGSDLVKAVEARRDEVYFILVMLSLVVLHTLSMTPAWDALLHRLYLMGRTGAFSLALAAVLVLPVIGYLIATRLCGLGKGSRKSNPFLYYAYSILPLALFLHLAHNIGHLSGEIGLFPAVLSDPMGMGKSSLALTGLSAAPLLSGQVLEGMQLALLGLGEACALYAAWRISGFFAGRNRLLSVAPMAVFHLTVVLFMLWLLAQPMAMKVMGGAG